MGPGTRPPLLTALLCCDAAGAWSAVPAVPALPSCLVLSPEIPQPENCRKQLLLALESPAVPLQNTLTLQFLLRHLGKVSQQAESNSLHPRALGEIFGPLLLRLPGARYVRLLVPAVLPAPAAVPARTRSPAPAGLHVGLNCWQHTEVGQSWDRAFAALSAWGLAAGVNQLTPGDVGAVPCCTPQLLFLTCLFSPCSPELSPDFSVLFLETLLQTKELEPEQLPPGTEIPLPRGLRHWHLWVWTLCPHDWVAQGVLIAWSLAQGVQLLEMCLEQLQETWWPRAFLGQSLQGRGLSTLRDCQ